MANTLSPRRRGKIGSSMIAALFDRSPYLTRLGLFNHFVSGTDIDGDSDERMGWGKRLQDDILDATAEEFGLEIVAKGDDDWVDHPDPALRCGATIDGEIVHHGRGPGVVEAKNVDRLIWRDTWTETTAPPHIELQVQHQLFVMGYSWAIIAALVGGNELHVIERAAIPSLQQRIGAELRRFWGQVGSKTPPDPLGIPEELPDLADLYPETIAEPVLELFGTATAADFHEAVREYRWAEDRAREAKSIGERAKARILAATRSHRIVRTHGFRIDIGKSPVKASTVSLPKGIRDVLAGLVDDVAGEGGAAIAEAIEWSETTRAPSIQTRIRITEVAGDPPAPDPLAVGIAAAADLQLGG